MTITIKLTFSEDWDDYKYVDPEITLADAIRELAEGVGYEIVETSEE